MSGGALFASVFGLRRARDAAAQARIRADETKRTLARGDALRAFFIESPDGRDCLAWMIERYHVLTTTQHPDREAMIYREGERNVVLDLMDQMRVDPDDFARMSARSHTGALTHE